MAQHWTPERSKLAHAAKAAIRMSGPPPEYRSIPNYDIPVEGWQITDFRTGEQHDILLFVSPRRINSFKVKVDGRLWHRCIGKDRFIRKLAKATQRFHVPQ